MNEYGVNEFWTKKLTVTFERLHANRFVGCGKNEKFFFVRCGKNEKPATQFCWLTLGRKFSQPNKFMHSDFRIYIQHLYQGLARVLNKKFTTLIVDLLTKMLSAMFNNLPKDVLMDIFA